jgi:non-ribosomal peptide synthetase component F
MTYGSLVARARELAVHLRALGVQPGVRVGLCVERSLDMLVGLLGILEAGGAYVPLDPAFPAERLSLMIEDAACPVLVTQKHLLKIVPTAGARTVALDALGQPPAAEAVQAATRSATADDLAYVIYTPAQLGVRRGADLTAPSSTCWSRRPARRARVQRRAVGGHALSFDIAGLSSTCRS